MQTNCVIYADDLKLSYRVSCTEDTQVLQSDLDRLALWSQTWRLKLNPAKCSAITFTLKRCPILCDYRLNGVVLTRGSEVRDLGVMLDSKLTFAKHVDVTVSKAKRMLGLLIRSMQQPACPRRAQLDHRAMLSAFYEHVRSVIEYASVVWSGAAPTHLKRLERIQHKFLIWLACTSNKPCHNLEYSNLLAHFQVSSIKSRFVQHDLMFIYNVFHGRLDSTRLVDSFSLSAPARRTRSPNLWYIPFGRVNTVQNSPFRRIPTVCNSLLTVQADVDFFCARFCSFKTAARKHGSTVGMY